MSSGLDGVVAAETRLSDVDGEGGRLMICGLDVETLARSASAEDAAALLLNTVSAPEESAVALQADLGAARMAAFPAVAQLSADALRAGPMGFVRSLLSSHEPGGTRAHGVKLIGAVMVYSAAAARLSEGLSPVPPDGALSQAADLLRMMHGAPAATADVAALDAYLATVCDHGLNASTFTARVIASTQAGLTAAVTGAMGALEGPLHGGAPGPVLDMFDAIGAPEHAERWLEDAMRRGERLMGFGHRIYKVRDPRADALSDALSKLNQNAGRLAFAKDVEAAALAVLARLKPGRRLEVNVEFYTALLLEALRIPRSVFSCVFACGRMPGWVAHALEQAATGRLIRPQSRYIGLRPRAAA